MSVHKTEKSGAEIVAFLKTFEGAASAFTDTSDTWALWIPEIATGEFPVTPGSQIYFPVILRQGQQLIAIRFFYDCRTGKIKFYTGAIPARLSTLPEFEHAVSELFRHSLPVEPIKQRPLKRAALAVSPTSMANTISSVREVPSAQNQHPGSARAEDTQENATPLEQSKTKTGSANASDVSLEKNQPLVRRNESSLKVVHTPLAATPSATSPSALALTCTSPEATPKEPTIMRVEICNGTTRVLQVLILVLGILGIAAIAAFVYLQITEDPGLKHHRLQLEQMRLRTNP